MSASGSLEARVKLGHHVALSAEDVAITDAAAVEAAIGSGLRTARRYAARHHVDIVWSTLNIRVEQGMVSADGESPPDFHVVVRVDGRRPL